MIVQRSTGALPWESRTVAVFVFAMAHRSWCRNLVLGDRDHERDAAGHVPRFNFTLQRMLSIKLPAAVVDRGA